MRTSTALATSALIASASALLTAIAAAPAVARPEPAPEPAISVIAGQSDDRACPLERVGTQFVRCDDLTGAGVPAPSHIPEQR
ncbi:hypothetical protein [Agromyces sp. ZXT2-3]|uniref:hypothetical protein n=1 Tax=Agromyces sp. ZXT2-3 TaxID=3461152 RepID=UPI004054AF01